MCNLNGPSPLFITNNSHLAQKQNPEGNQRFTLSSKRRYIPQLRFKERLAILRNQVQMQQQMKIKGIMRTKLPVLEAVVGAEVEVEALGDLTNHSLRIPGKVIWATILQVEIETVIKIWSRKKKKTPDDHVFTENNIDTSIFLWPSKLFPVLNAPDWDPDEAMEETGMELVGVEWDPRDMVLDLKSCFMEMELLLHCSPQLFTTEEWLGVARTPDDVHGFKVVVAIQMKTHVLAFFAKDNNSRSYWLSREDMNSTRLGRVPDVVFDFWGWSEFTVKWLRSEESRHDKKAVGDVIGHASGSQPTRGIGRYLRDEVLNLAVFKGIAPVMRQALKSKYARDLGVHGKLESYTSARRARLIQAYNWMSDQTHIEAARSEFFSSKKTDIKDTPSFFDPGEVADTILLFDGLGPIIFGESWVETLAEQGSQATTDIMRQFYMDLPTTLSRVQRLSLKPVVDLLPEEREYLIFVRGDTVNPLVRYFQSPASEAQVSSTFSSSPLTSLNSSCSPSPAASPMAVDDSMDVDDENNTQQIEEIKWVDEVEPLSLLRDPQRAPMPTYLYTDHIKKSMVAFNTTYKDSDNSPPNAIHYKREPASVRREKTVDYIQRNEKGIFVAPCLWHPDLTEKRQQLVFSEKEAHRNPHLGIRKGTRKQVEAEKSARTAGRKELLEELGRPPTEDEVVKRSSRLKARVVGAEGEKQLQTQASRTLAPATLPRKKRKPTLDTAGLLKINSTE
ncbi:hypothetical protein C8R43DRAFT_952411 [Mycena crocata]|nr:hypothetical protein C8R43DRAFT_952411 [Mycena crocata]